MDNEELEDDNDFGVLGPDDFGVSGGVPDRLDNVGELITRDSVAGDNADDDDEDGEGNGDADDVLMICCDVTMGEDDAEDGPPTC